MKQIANEDLQLGSVMDLDVRPGGIVPRRLPAWTRTQIPDLVYDFMVTMPAGVRVEMMTDATELELDVMITRLEINEVPARPVVFDLVVNDLLAASQESDQGCNVLFDSRTQEIGFRDGAATTIRFELPQSERLRPVELWLPHQCVVEIRAVRVDDEATIEPLPRRPRWAHHGSSISHCSETPHPTETWPAIAARGAGVDLLNLAFSGQCMLDPMVARTIRDTQADYISIKAGINIINADSMRERTFTTAFHGFLDTIRDGHPETPLLIVTPVACPIVEQHPGPTEPGNGGRYFAVQRPKEMSVGALTLQRIRTIESDIVNARRTAGDLNLHLLDGLKLFGLEEAAVDLPDHLHPNPAGYKRIGQRFTRLVFDVGGAFHRDRSAVP